MAMTKKANQQNLDRYIRLAKATGCPPDQIKNFCAGDYCPQPMQLRFHAAARLCDREDGPTQIGLGGARGPGKSHAIFAQVALDDCVRAPGIHALYLRKTGKQARAQFDELRRAVLMSIPHDYKQQQGIVTFLNESYISIGHFRNERDIDDYLGFGYEVIAVEEATTLSSTKIQGLRDCNRTSLHLYSRFRPRMYTSTNPGGIGHAWYKQRFIVPWRDGTETDTRFIFGTVDDNIFIDPGYKKKLEENTGWRLRAYRYGDWDISAGQFFTTWRDDVHVKEFEVVHGRRFWMSLDYGFTHYTVATLFSEHDGDIDVVDSHAERRWLVKRHADAIKAMLARHGLSLDKLDDFVAGPDVWAQRGTELTIAQQYEQEGIYFSRANTDRIAGAAEILALLGDTEAGIRSRLRVHPRCGRLRECLPAMQHDPHRPEDVLKVNCDEDGLGGDDDYDSFRYGVMARLQGGITVIPNPLAGYRG